MSNVSPAPGLSASALPSQRLTELGLVLPPVPVPQAAYVPAVVSGGFVYTSGQIPTVDGKLLATGKVGAVAGGPGQSSTVAGGPGQSSTVAGGPGQSGAVADGGAVDAAEAAGLARVCALNALAAAASVAGPDGLDGIARIVKVVGFVASAPGFNGQPQVVNGASQLLLDVFGENGKHARSAVGMAELPLDAPVEVELIAELRR